MFVLNICNEAVDLWDDDGLTADAIIQAAAAPAIPLSVREAVDERQDINDIQARHNQQAVPNVPPPPELPPAPSVPFLNPTSMSRLKDPNKSLDDPDQKRTLNMLCLLAGKYLLISMML